MLVESVIRKIRKLLETAEHQETNENLAAAAAAKARELLSKYNLSLAEIKAEDVQDTLQVGPHGYVMGKKVPRWCQYLSSQVAEVFDCFVYISTLRGTRQKTLIFVGTEADGQVAVYTFEYLVRELLRLYERSKDDLKQWFPDRSLQTMRTDYLNGATSRVNELLREHHQAIKQREQEQCSALVVYKKNSLEKYLKNLHLRKQQNSKRRDDYAVYSKGYSDGKQIKIREGVASTRNEHTRLGRA